MFEKLLQPGKVGNFTVKNRMKYAATVNNFCDTKTGLVTDREVAYLADRAKGGFGIVVSAGGYTNILGKGYVGQMALDRDEVIPGLKRIADAIKAEGAMAVGQIMHTGRYGHAHEYGVHETIAGGKKVPGLPIGPSDFTSPMKRYGTCRGMTLEEIKEEIEAHAQAARRFKEAGFDGVELCSIVGYLIADFLSPWTNKRTDEYGGTLEKRAKFMLDIIKRIKEVVGKDYPFLMRLNSTDLIDGGNTDEEYIQLAKWAEPLGIDLFSTTVGWHESPGAAITAEKRPGDWLYLPERWKAAGVKSPICMAYRLNVPDVPEKAIADGKIDYWEVCRPGIADAYLAKKITEGRPEDIVTCTACNQGCFYYVFTDVIMGCMVNPRVGKEWDATYDVRPAEKKKKVLVVGGGPAGMEAARVAALRGHDVTLYEKADKLGGELLLGVKSPLLYDWAYLTQYYVTQLKKTGVKVELGKEATAATVKKEAPDALIVATGAKPAASKIPGSDKANVTNIFDVLEEKVTMGEKVVVIGGSEIALQTAEWIAEQSGKQVTVLEKGKYVGQDVNIFNTLSHRRTLAALKVKTLVNVNVEAITDEGVEITTLGGKEATIEADTVVLAEGFAENNALLGELKANAAAEIYAVGDCAGFKKLYESIHDGYRAGNKV